MFELEKYEIVKHTSVSQASSNNGKELIGGLGVIKENNNEQGIDITEFHIHVAVARKL